MWVTIRATPELKAVVKKIAKNRGKNASDAVRDIIMEEARRVGIPLGAPA
jgi:predicted DNA-binding protein